MKRTFNFGAGPASIPTEVLEEAQKELLDFKGSGLSIMEASHRSALYEDVHNEAISLMRELYEIPTNYKVLFLQGGASTQFTMIPMNLSKGGVIEFVNSGAWSKKAIKEVDILGFNSRVIASSEDTNFDKIPNDISFSENIDYAHITSNNTIYGTQYKKYPQTKAPLVVDASSDIFSYKIDWSNIGLLYAGAQKNAGPSGVTIVIIREDLIGNHKENTPSMLRYSTHADTNSLYNTPPTFGIYILGLTLKWIKAKGGIDAINRLNQQKANLLYDTIDNSNGFYVGHAQKESRSLMNVSFNIKGKDSQLEKELIEITQKSGMVGLKGHRSVGGLRASIYNAVSLEAVEALVEIMNEFKEAHSDK
jgi:phosphoserine aminotransferase